MQLKDFLAKKGRARGRHVPGQMNQTESRFAERLRLSGQPWGFEEITLKLGPDCRLTPDFWAIGDDMVLDFYEVKGHRFNAEESKAKFRTAAGKFPFRFWWCQEEKGGQWTITTPFPEDR